MQQLWLGKRCSWHYFSKSLFRTQCQTARYRGALVRIKELRFDRKKDIPRDVMKEMKLMRELRHDNINRWDNFFWTIHLCRTLAYCSVTRLGDFWKFLVTKFHAKVAQIIGNYLGCLEKYQFEIKNRCVHFWATLWKIWATFYSIIWSHWTQDRGISKA